MTVTTTGLIRAAGLCAAVAGGLFVAVQVNHPTLTAESVGSTEVVLRGVTKAVMAALALAGITGLYAHQVRRAGLLGLVGYLVFAVGYLLMFCVEVVAAAVLPSVADTSPGYVGDVIAAALGGSPEGDIGGMQVVLGLAGAGYLVGGLVFGIALYRAGVLARWACALLAASTLGTAALAVLPESFNRPLAVPAGVALVGLGLSLWRDRTPAAEARPEPALR